MYTRIVFPAMQLLSPTATPKVVMTKPIIMLSMPATIALQKRVAMTFVR